ncbi:PH domain-containing protein [Microbacterium oxydans]|uniref:PH domain-containing protein n=1 Tax=Microbacterium oxydans TaxID=82380 RepID=UPI0024ADC432|nr:PH domain-containing protein [Microbacterium oxydans]
MTEPQHPEGARTYRASSGLVILIPSTLLALFLLGDAVVRGSWAQMLLLAPWVLLAVWAVYELSYVSSVRVDSQGVVVQNMLRRTSFGWANVRDIDLRWQLQFSLDDGRDLTCYGGPARARPPRPSRGDDDERKAPAGLLALTDIRDLWEGAPPVATSIRRTWDVPALIALAVIVLWAVGAILVTGTASA